MNPNFSTGRGSLFPPPPLSLWATRTKPKLRNNKSLSKRKWSATNLRWIGTAFLSFEKQNKKYLLNFYKRWSSLKRRESGFWQLLALSFHLAPFLLSCFCILSLASGITSSQPLSCVEGCWIGERQLPAKNFPSRWLTRNLARKR